MSTTTQMSTLRAAAGSATAFPATSWEARAVRCTVRWGRSGAVLSVNGELDAANAADIADFAQHCAELCEWLVLDLCQLEFIGTAGFSVLQEIGARCADAKVYWAMVPGLAVSRLLRVCDPDRELPVAESVAVALATVQQHPGAVS